jgi:hypothetical protein
MTVLNGRPGLQKRIPEVPLFTNSLRLADSLGHSHCKMSPYICNTQNDLMDHDFNSATSSQNWTSFIRRDGLKRRRLYRSTGTVADWGPARHANNMTVPHFKCTWSGAHNMAKLHFKCLWSDVFTTRLYFISNVYGQTCLQPDYTSFQMSMVRLA